MLQLGEMLTQGKSKRIYATDDPELAVIYFKDDAMAFHGMKRGRILGKGEVNNAICHTLFTLLEQNGVATHYVQQLDDRQCVIRRCDMLPVEIKVRNRVAGTLGQRLGLREGSELTAPVIEFMLKDEELENPMLNVSHITAMQMATQEEMDFITGVAEKVNDILRAYMSRIGVELIDFQLEFGRCQGKLLVADEISPDTARFWDAQTREPMDIDRFRRDLGDVEQGYHELLQRMVDADQA